MVQRTFLIRATLRGWTVSRDGQELSRSWSRTFAEETAMEAALDVSQSGASVEVVIQGLLGGFKTLARNGGEGFSDPLPRRSLPRAPTWATLPACSSKTSAPTPVPTNS
jgi:hypothetical protein